MPDEIVQAVMKKMDDQVMGIVRNALYTTYVSNTANVLTREEMMRRIGLQPVLPPPVELLTPVPVHDPVALEAWLDA